jgi:hypothetical protein
MVFFFDLSLGGLRLKTHSRSRLLKDSDFEPLNLNSNLVQYKRPAQAMKMKHVRP